MEDWEWEELLKLGDGHSDRDRFEFLLGLTELEDEHPEDYEGACKKIHPIKNQVGTK